MEYTKNKRLLKIGQLLVSALLLWLVFKKMDVGLILKQILEVPLWYLVVSVLFWIGSSFIVAWRWAILILDDYDIGDVWFIVKSTMIARFYSIFLPSSMGADLIKWLPLIKKYPQLSKAGLAGSVVVDRIVGFTAFVIVAVLSVVVGKIMSVQFPNFILWMFLICMLAVVIFYGLVYWVDVDKLFNKIKIPGKIKRLFLVVLKTDKKALKKGLWISLLAAPLWSLSSWLALVAFDTGVPLLETMIIMPVINLILILPISVAGFGPREGLFVYLFSTYAVSNESLLASSAFSGILSLMFAVLGGALTLF